MPTFPLRLINILPDDEVVHVFQDAADLIRHVGTKDSYTALQVRGEPLPPSEHSRARWRYSFTRRAFAEGRPQPGDLWTEPDGIWRVVIMDWDAPRGVLILGRRQYTVSGITPMLTVTPDPPRCRIQDGILTVP